MSQDKTEVWTKRKRIAYIKFGKENIKLKNVMKFENRQLRMLLKVVYHLDTFVSLGNYGIG